MNKLIKYFELDKADGYKFEWSDITCILYTICVAGIILGYNMTPLFFGSCVLSLVTCVKARRVNLIVINAVMTILNLFYLLG